MNKIIFNIPKEYENLSGIYIITNSVNDQVYIGRTKNLLKRYKRHCQSVSNNRENHKFKLLLLQYPEVQFVYSLLEVTDNLKIREEYYIKYYSSVEKGLNILSCDEDYINKVSIRKSESCKKYILLLNSIRKKEKRDKEQNEVIKPVKKKRYFGGYPSKELKDFLRSLGKARAERLSKLSTQS
jgi:group I intron endonuclease